MLYISGFFKYFGYDSITNDICCQEQLRVMWSTVGVRVSTGPPRCAPRLRAEMIVSTGPQSVISACFTVTTVPEPRTVSRGNLGQSIGHLVYFRAERVVLWVSLVVSNAHTTVVIWCFVSKSDGSRDVRGKQQFRGSSVWSGRGGNENKAQDAKVEALDPQQGYDPQQPAR